MRRTLLITLAALSLATDPAVAQMPNRALTEALGRIYRLEQYTAFDWIVGRLDKGTLTLQGFVRTPQLKQQAEAAARKGSGVDEIVNRLEVLPAHASDDDLRVRAYVAIYASGALERYAPGGQFSDGTRNEVEDAARVGLDATGVGRGPHAIHIIVSGARILLLGEVRTTGDRQQAEARLRSLAGVLGVINQLRVATSSGQVASGHASRPTSRAGAVVAGTGPVSTSL